MAMGVGEITTQPKFSRILSLPHNREDHFRLRYCPICARKDREKYGETYWHRRHQIRGLNVCSQHGCRLVDSAVSLMSYNASYVLKCAELEICETDCGESGVNNRLGDFASYVVEILEQDRFAPYNETLKMLYGKSKMLYAYGRHKGVDMESLNRDFRAWKQDVGMENGISEMWQIKKLLSGYRRNPYEVCQIAFFLKADIEEIAHPSMERDDATSFDDRVSELIMGEKRFREIAGEVGVSLSTIQNICDERGLHRIRKRKGEEERKTQRIKEERKYWLDLMKKYPNMSYNALCQIKEHRKHINYLRRNDREWTDAHWFQGCKKKREMKDWKKLDDEMLPKVQEIIAALQLGRPQNICVYAVAKRTDISSRTFNAYLPKCKAEIRKYETSTNELYAKQVIWAIGEVRKEGKIPDWKQIKRLTNIGKDKALTCLPYLKVIAEPEVYELVQGML